ncbi:MAG: DNA methyltransferase [Candidatus Odinarchaeota archaeon]
MPDKNESSDLKGADKLIRLHDVFKVTNRTEENIRSKIESGLINKYDKHGTKLANPLQETGFFKLSEVLKAYNITDHEKVRKEFVRKRRKPDSILEDIAPSRITVINSLEELEGIPSESYDTCLSFFSYDLDLKKKPFTTKDRNELPIISHHQWMKEIVRILNKQGNFLIHSSPEHLPYYGVFLEECNMIFRCWIANRLENGVQSAKRLDAVTNGTLFYLKSNKNFRLNRIREITHCEYCRENIKDYGGKKLLIHDNGAIISDVWKNTISKGDQHSDELVRRLINLSCTDDSSLLLAPFRGELHERYRTKLHISG